MRSCREQLSAFYIKRRKVLFVLGSCGEFLELKASHDDGYVLGFLRRIVQPTKMKL